MERYFYHFVFWIDVNPSFEIVEVRSSSNILCWSFVFPQPRVSFPFATPLCFPLGHCSSALRMYITLTAQVVSFCLLNWYCDGTFLVIVHECIVHRVGGAIVGDGVVQSLHFRQKCTHLDVRQYPSLCIIPQLDHRLFVGCVGESTHIHLEGILFEITPSFHQGCQSCQSHHGQTFFPHGSHHHTHGHDE